MAEKKSDETKNEAKNVAKQNETGKKTKKVKIVEMEEAKELKKSLRKQKPELPEDVQRALEIRRERKKKEPEFRRQEWFRYKKLGTKWRKPKGLHSKMRLNKKYRPPLVRVGYRGPVKARGLHPSGFEEVLVYNPSQLDGVDPKRQAVRIAHTVGQKKREAIIERARELKIRVLNGGV